MECPVCNTDSILFRKMWLKSGFGVFVCEHCGADLRNKKKPLLTVISFLLGAFAASVGIYFRSWLIFFIALIIVLAIDAVMDMNFRQLVENQKHSTSSVE